LVIRISKERFKRYHQSDGLVLTHVGPYASGVGDYSFKWKYPELISVDFQLVRVGRRIEFHLGGANGKDTVCVRTSERAAENDDALMAALVEQRGASPHDPLSLLNKNQEPVIAEMTFNRETGMWVFHGLRSKRTPNHVRIETDK
jgi:hypothetical protein